jgi:uncharacterized membrane protein YgaE (UPF0421/DUF939 family)
VKVSGLADSPLFLKPNTENDPIENNLEEKKRIQPSNRATLKSRHHDTMIASISKVTREIGKEASTYRLTNKEKTALVEIIYHFRMRNVRLTENEIARIALNFIIDDFKYQKKDSILARVIDYLKA